MARQKLETRIRRDQIAEATLALVTESGLRRLSVAAVARRVGITPSALYRHYPGKDAIVDAVLERMRARLAAIVEQAAAGPGDATDALRRLFRSHMDLVSRNGSLFPLLMSDAFQSGTPERRQRMFTLISGYAGRVASLIRAGQRAGTIRPDVPARTLAMLFIGIVQPHSMLAVMSGGRYDARRPARESWTVYEEILRGSTGRPTAAVANRRR